MSPTNVMPASSSPPPASLLGLPVELRLRIYEIAYDGNLIGDKLTWKEGPVLTIYGTSDCVTECVRAYGSPFTLLRVCWKLHHEIKASIPSIRDMRLDLCDLTMESTRKLLDKMSHDQIAMLRRLNITGWNKCTLVQPTNLDERVRPGLRHSGTTSSSTEVVDIHDSLGNKLCDRSLHLDLTIYERYFDKAQWNRLLNADHRAISLGTGSYVGAPIRDRDYYKGYYLLRNLDGCVKMPQPITHPGRYVKKCSSIVDIQQSLSPLIDDEGALHVTKEAILGVVQSVISNSTNTMALRGW